MKIFALLLLFTALWCLDSLTPSLGYRPVLEQFQAEDGLSMNTVNDLATDDRGHLWIATQAGLNRFDGEHFRIYSKQDAPYGPSGNHIERLLFSSQKELWLLTLSDGLNLYHPGSGRFEILGAEADLPLTGIRELAEDKQGMLWLLMDDAKVWRYDPKRRQRLDSQQLQTNTVSQLRFYATPSGDLYLAGDSLWQLDDSKSWQQMTILPQSAQVESLIQAKDGSLWLASKGTLWHWSLGTEAVPYSINQLGDAGIRHMVLDPQQRLWLAVDKLGLLRFTPQTRELLWQQNSDGKTIQTLHLDGSNQLWIATKGAGLGKLDLNQEGMGKLLPNSFENHNLGNGDVRAIFRDHQGQLWVGTASGLYQALEFDSGKIQGFKPSPLASQLLDKAFIGFIKEDSQGQLWIGTRGEGLLIFNAERDSYLHYRHQANEPGSLPANTLYSLTFDQSGIAWIATKEAGVSRYLGIEKGFAAPDATPLPKTETTSVLEDNGGNIWITSYGEGLFRLKPDGSVSHWSTDTEVPLPSKHLFSIYQHPDGQLWVASSDGVFSFTPDSGQYQMFDRQHGLIGDVAYLMQHDADNKLWIGSASGLSWLDPATGTSRNFTYEDGLQANEFNFGAGFLDRDGSLFLGGVKGLNHIQPSALPARKPPAQPIIDELQALGQTQEHAPKPWSRQKLVLGVDALPLSLKFHSPNLHHARHLEYQYKLEGMQQEWLNTRGARTAFFPALKPGDYRFMVRAVDIDGNTSPAQSLLLSITPRPWQSPWAYTIYSLLLLSLIFGFAYNRWQKFIEQQKLLQQVASSEQKLQLALIGSGDEFWDWDLQAQEANRNNAFLWYPEPETHLKDTLERCVHPEDLPLIWPEIDACLHKGRQEFELSYRGKTQDDSWLWVLNRGRVMARDQEGRPLRITGTIKDIQKLKETESALRRFNQELEQRVKQRTEALQQSNDELNHALEELRLAQSELLDKEKMATLGGLVASITHEVNTPIGICVTAASHLAENVKAFNKRFYAEDVDQQDFEQYQSEVADCSRLMLTNLERAAKLIRSFKQLSVDQSHEELREFNLGHYLDEIFLSLNPMLHRSPHKYSYQCPADITLNSTPGVFYQIISNLFTNSLVHAFPEGSEGRMSLNVSRTDNGIELVYRDDGCGMNTEVQQNIFVPFFTTKRGKGGSGLGMNIVYNLVTQVLGGEIRLISAPGHGSEFRIILPNDIEVSSGASQ